MNKKPARQDVKQGQARPFRCHTYSDLLGTGGGEARLNSEPKFRTRLPIAVLAILAASAMLCARGPQVVAQNATPAPGASAMVQPAIGELRGTLGGLRIQKWKAPAAVKEDAGQNVSRIQLDLDNTLPPLLAQADAAPGSVANAFAVYRNLDALYEVLLRVSGTAELAASDAEAAAVSHALATLGDSRRTLADSILNTSHAQEAQLKQERQAAPPAAAPPASASTSTVVSDGPATSAPHKKPKPKPKPASTPQT